MEQAGSFGRAAAQYERGRPPYPAEAIDWLLPPGAQRVLDLGAGTGKLTRAVVGRGLEVVALEPLTGMREKLAEAVPGVEILDGYAESIPSPDAGFDVVLAAQAWHWVDRVRAVPEVARILRPGGRLGLVWNVRDERIDWVARLGAIIAGSNEDGSDADIDSQAVAGPPFGPMAEEFFEWRHRISAESLIDLVASRSYVITLEAGAREALLDEVRALLRTHPDLVGRDQLEMPYVTRAFRTDLA